MPNVNVNVMKEREQREKNYKTFVEYGNTEAHGEIEYHCSVGGGSLSLIHI